MSEEMLYPVNEMFVSVQFEGTNCGTLNHFVRLAYCSRACTFCDTVDRDNVWRKLTSSEIVKMLTELNPSVKRVIITGGEPTMHDLTELLTTFRANGFYVAIESNGDFLDKLANWRDLIDWITVSPKSALDNDKLRAVANETKYIVPDHEGVIDWTQPIIYLQPEWNNPSAFKEILKLLSEHPGTKVSIQTHKYLNIR